MRISSAILMLLPIAGSAQTFQGRVINGSTGNPLPSSQVILFTSSGEQGHALTNDGGEFQIVPKIKLAPHSSAILQVTKDGVDYFQPVIQGPVANFKVYQAANWVGHIRDQLSILQFQTVGERLQVTELHALNNLSNPPTTQVNPNNFVLPVPQGARIEPATISSPEGGTTKIPLARVAGSTDQYRIAFPLKPGLTKYAIRYEVPYEAHEFVFRRRTQYPIDRIGVIVPKSIRFRALLPHSFHPVANAEGAQEQQVELDNVETNAAFAFVLSGTGELIHSFRPLHLDERPSATLPAPVTNAVSPHSPVAPASATPFGLHSFFTVHRRMVTLGALLLAGALALGFVLRAKWKSRDQVRSFSTDVNLSSQQNESAEPMRPAARDTHH